MSMNCELRPLSPAYAQWLLRHPDEVHQFYEQVWAGTPPKEALGDPLDLHKDWHGLHYLLTGTAWEGDEPWSYLLLGGEQVGDEEEYALGYGPARVLLPAQVAALYQAVAPLGPAEVSARFNPADMDAQEVYPGGWAEYPAENLEGLQHSLAELQTFLHQVNARQLAVIVAMV